MTQPAAAPLSTDSGTSTRRTFLLRSGLFIASSLSLGPGAPTAFAGERPAAGDKSALRIGLLSDIHYADLPSKGKRHYRDALGKMRRAVRRFNEERVDLLVQLGDLVDEAPTTAGELDNVVRAEAELAQFRGDRHYVLGNHCIWTLTKEEFLGATGSKDRERSAHYSFDRGGYHFIVLDGCYRADGEHYGRRNNQWFDSEIPPAQRDWLEADLAKTELPSIVFVHQRLDTADKYAVRSATEVRRILEQAGRVRAVFQGHNHVNDCRVMGGIAYVTLQAMIDLPADRAENTAWSILEVWPSGALHVRGFARQKPWLLNV